MNNITELIRQRRSIRTFDGRTLDENTKENLLNFTKKIENPFDIPVEFKLMEAKKYGLNCPVISGTDLFLGGKIKCLTNANVAFGYSFEAFILYAQSLGIGTVWLGGTMNRTAFEQAMELGEDEMMPCATPLGYAAKKMSVRENIMRKAIKADERFPFEELFFSDSFNTPLTKEKAGKFAQPLEMVRLAPSAVNKQPWRVVISDNTAHFYLKRSLDSGNEGKPDMQKIDMGIALCHFALAAKENNLSIEFVQECPKLVTSSEFEYIASYVLK